MVWCLFFYEVSNVSKFKSSNKNLPQSPTNKKLNWIFYSLKIVLLTFRKYVYVLSFLNKYFINNIKSFFFLISALPAVNHYTDKDKWFCILIKSCEVGIYLIPRNNFITNRLAWKSCYSGTLSESKWGFLYTNKNL